MNEPMLSIVVSVYNEEEVLPEFRRTIEDELKQLGSNKKVTHETKQWKYEIIFVNDGSQDKSKELLDQFAKEREFIKVVHFARNFGHESAMIAGIDRASGDFIICMDADLQNPPKEIHRMLDQYELGYDVVLMARKENKDAGIMKNMASKVFYGVLNAVSSVKFEQSVSDFFGISKRVATILRGRYREVNRYLRGYIQNVGFQRVILEYKAEERGGGHSKYSFKKLFNVALDALTCFSKTPLRAGLYVGGISGILSVFLIVYYGITYWLNGEGNGMILLCFFLFLFFTVLFLVLGIMGEYIGVLLEEVKDRPIYLVKEERNLVPVSIDGKRMARGKEVEKKEEEEENVQSF